jgi:hypothetical protein
MSDLGKLRRELRRLMRKADEGDPVLEASRAKKIRRLSRQLKAAKHEEEQASRRRARLGDGSEG